jgi:RimJ/RimL family protein N-acetyltransferase
MSTSPQPYTIGAILDNGFGEILAEDGERACLKVSSFIYVEGPFHEGFAKSLLLRMPDEAILTSANADWYAYFIDNPIFACTPIPRWRYIWPSDRTAVRDFHQPADLLIGSIGMPEIKELMEYSWAEGIFDSYDTPEGFLQKGFGTCIKENEKIVSVCLSFATWKRFAEIEVDTAPSHQGRGLAKAASNAFIHECFRRNLIPYWDSSNPPSSKLAEALGFSLDKEYRALEIKRY